MVKGVSRLYGFKGLRGVIDRGTPRSRGARDVKDKGLGLSLKDKLDIVDKIPGKVEFLSPRKLEEKATDALLITSIPKSVVSSVSNLQGALHHADWVAGLHGVGSVLGPIGGGLMVLSSLASLAEGVKRKEPEYKEKLELLTKLSNVGWGVQVLSTFLQNTLLPSGVGLVLSKLFGAAGAGLQIAAGGMELKGGKELFGSKRDAVVIGSLDVLAGAFWMASTFGVAPTLTALGFVISTVLKQAYTHQGTVGRISKAFKGAFRKVKDRVVEGYKGLSKLSAVPQGGSS